MKGLDTNVLIRYLVQDDPQQSRLASDFIENCCTDKDPCYLGHIVLCEIVWVLESNYHQRMDEIARIIEHLLQTAQIEVQDPGIVWKALKDYKESNADFPDHLIAHVNISMGCETTVTLDKKAGKQQLFEFISEAALLHNSNR